MQRLMDAYFELYFKGLRRRLVRCCALPHLGLPSPMCRRRQCPCVCAHDRDNLDASRWLQVQALGAKLARFASVAPALPKRH